MKERLKKALGIIIIFAYCTFTIIMPMTIYAEGSEVSVSNDIPINVQYPLIAYFEGIEEGVDMEYNSVVIPEGFTTGNVVVKAKICSANDNSIIPYSSSADCDDIREITLHPEGMVNGVQINNTARVSQTGVQIYDGFNNYGKANVHFVSNVDSNVNINTFVNIVSENLISIKADTPLAMSFSFGSLSTNHALVTSSNRGNISIFFGNNETSLTASGPNVDKITRVVGGIGSSLNQYGGATVLLPALSKETTTTIVVTILLKDGTSVDREVNINRTSILLQHSNGAGDNSVYGGYVFNKAYLYNNQNHSDDIFDAYLQITLYKDDVVVGFKQIKIDDEEYINNLRENESGSIELYSESQIPLYGRATDDVIEGVNKVSVFLTNGPIEFGEKLPSIEFGIGSGVTLEWEEN